MMRTLCALLVTAALAPPARGDETPPLLKSAPEGWTDLLANAGPELTGWTRLPIPPGGKKSDASQWSLDPETGALVCKGDGGHEWLRWDREVGDSVFHVEWRFVPATGSGKTGYNSGVYARNSDDARVWHQAQAGGGSGGFLFGESPDRDGKPRRFNLSKQAGQTRVKPAGEWNTFEITSKGKTLSLWVNGAVTCTLDDCEFPRGYVGLEAEGYRIEFRNVKLKVLD